MEIDQRLDVAQESYLDRIVLNTTVAMFVIILVLSSLQVLIRSLSLPVNAPWTEAGSRVMLIIATFFGAAVATRNREHIRMVYVLNKLEDRKPALREKMDLISSIVVIAFVAVALLATAPAIIWNWNVNFSGVRFVSFGHVYLGITIGLLLMLLYEVQYVYENGRGE
jgi:TRAP-type transport system small permease protein